MTSMPQPPAYTLREPENDYHAKSKSGEIMSSGMLKTFRNCPASYYAKIAGLSEDGDSNAYRFGRATHKIILEGIEAFNKAFAIGGPVNEKTNKSYGVGTKAHDEWLAAKGYSRDQVINDTEADQLVTMAKATHRHKEVGEYLSFGWPELVARADMRGVPCQIRMDWLTHDTEGNYAIVDLKTTADIVWFEADARRYGYLNQFAFYRDVFMAAAGIKPQLAVIAVEKQSPWRVGVWRIPDEILDQYSAGNREALEYYKQCKASDVWPTGYEGIRTFSIGA